MSKTYTRPVLHVQGKLEAVTHGSSTGTVTDAAFPAGTPISSFTFS